jgi:hypothetical protein
MSTTLVYVLYTEDIVMAGPAYGVISEGGFERQGLPWVKRPAKVTVRPQLGGCARWGVPWLVNPRDLGVDGIVGAGAVGGVTIPDGVI